MNEWMDGFHKTPTKAMPNNRNVGIDIHNIIAGVTPLKSNNNASDHTYVDLP